MKGDFFCGKWWDYTPLVFQNRKCGYKGKSIRKDLLEDEFEKLLVIRTPPAAILRIAESVFNSMWDARRIEQQERKSLLASQNLEIEKDIEKAVDFMMDANSPAIIKRIKESVCKLGDKKRVLEETSSKQAYL